MKCILATEKDGVPLIYESPLVLHSKSSYSVASDMKIVKSYMELQEEMNAELRAELQAVAELLTEKEVIVAELEAEKVEERRILASSLGVSMKRVYENIRFATTPKENPAIMSSAQQCHAQKRLVLSVLKGDVGAILHGILPIATNQQNFELILVVNLTLIPW